MKTSVKTKAFGITTCIAMMMSLVSLPAAQINAATPAPNEPTKEEINHVEYIFANGVPITITGIDSSKNRVSWNGGDMEISTKANVFGGSHDSETILQETSVTMESGTVNAVIGGGLHSSHVVNSNVVIHGGSIPSQVVGGGASSLVKDGHPWYSGDAKNSPCIVENANVVINGGNNYSLVFGGGEGISYTGRAAVTINAGDFSNAYVTAGGSNGYTNNAVLNINGGTNYNVVQSVNRGSMESAELNVTDGTISNFYLGGETPDSGVTGTIGSVKANITGGMITNIQKGKSGSVEFLKDTSALSLTYHRSLIANANEITESFGTSATDTYDDSITGIALNKSELTLTQGAVAVVKADVTSGADATAEQRKVIWSSNNEKVATVKDGNITAVAAGTAIITAKTESGKTASCTVTVTKPVKVETPSVDTTKPTDEIKVGVNDEKAEQILGTAADQIVAGSQEFTDADTAKAVVEAAKAGKTVTVAADVKQADSANAEVKAAAEKIQKKLEALTAESKNTATVAMYLELNVQIKADNAVLGNITKLNDPLTFTVMVPEKLQKEGRIFYVLRVHDGTVEKLATTVKGSVLTFETDRFSTYALVYEDKKVEDSGTTPDPTPKIQIRNRQHRIRLYIMLYLLI